MGAADVIPGVSGGTIAFITGIYDQLIGSINSINAEAVKLFFTGKFKEFWKHINGSFLVALAAGIGISVVSLAGLMQMLLNDYPIQTWAFFFGLIVASSIFILRGISGWKMRDGLFVALGIVLGVVICTLSHVSIVTPLKVFRKNFHRKIKGVDTISQIRARAIAGASRIASRTCSVI